ncbi:MAG TPA: sulfatase, partial [Candidatus Polarisedimenticolia bacterium]|nr:sulfatase [Candidatus Polarisedimenticolia bacterium]
MKPMNKWRAAVGLVCFILLSLPIAGAQEPRPPTEPPAPTSTPAPARSHLFLYIVDGLGATEIPAFGYPRMTAVHLGSQMDRGVTFLTHYSVSPWTVPSVASLFTSLYPSAHGVQKAGDRLPAAAKTLAELMKENGYETALFSAHPLVGPLSGLDQGFDWVEEVPGPFSPTPARGPAETSATLNRRILTWLEKRVSSAPTFITVVSGDLLEPFGAPDPQGSQFIGPEELAWYREVRGKLLAMRPGPLSLATGKDLELLKVDPTQFATAARKVYDGAIYFNDRQIRGLRDTLESREGWRDTLFVVTSTHGIEFLEHGLFGHGTSLYDSSILVPVVMSHARLFPKPNQIRSPTASVDLMPTILTLLQIPVPGSAQGLERDLGLNPQSLRGARPVFSEAQPAGELPTGTMSMVAENSLKYIAADELPAGVERKELELFRMVQTPADWEKKNWVASAPVILSRERDYLIAWRAEKGKLQLSPDPAPSSPDPRLKEVLGALGYLQGREPIKVP